LQSGPGIDARNDTALPCKCGPTVHFVDATDAPLTREGAVVRAAFVKAGAEPGWTNLQRHFIF